MPADDRSLQPAPSQPDWQAEEGEVLLRALEGRLEEREQELSVLVDKLGVFEHRYNHILGFRYRRLADMVDRLMDLREPPGPVSVLREPKADGLGAAYAALGRDAARERPRPPESARLLFRKLVRQVHPDLGATAEERERRTRMMVLANLAYERGDTEALRELLEDWELDPEQVPADEPGAELTRLLRRISKVYKRLEAVERELKELGSGHMGTLLREAEEAGRRGVDLLAQMGVELDRVIAKTRTELDEAEQEPVAN